ncbi:MAG: hypothetical protein HW406_2242 [Candidatus Brocadiaceae bacterium]|nr:hypothetical protein [Candidatus Brocadiaceae bacterium]
MNPRVKAVKARDNYKLEIIFSSGEVGIYDCSPLLSFGVFTELKDKIYFQQARAAYGTVVWPHEQDICPDTLYLDSIKIKKSPNKSLQRTGTKSRDSR